MPKKTGLGKGIDAIFLENDFDNEEVRAATNTLRISQIDPTPGQPRKNFDQNTLAALADSIAAHGVLQPILVREVGPERYQIVAGERRWRASKMAGLTEIPVIIVEMDEKTAAQVALIENIQREDLNPMEEAMGYATLATEYHMTQEEISEKVGKSRSAIANAVRLLDLPDEIRKLVENSQLSAGHARTLLGLKSKDMMPLLAEKIIAGELSVREAEEEVRKMNRLAETVAVIEPTENEFRVDYVKELERKMTSRLGRRVKVCAKGAKKSVTLYFEDNDDLDTLLESICGKGFLSEI